MIRHLPVSFLLFTTAAHAQQPDSLATAAPDSLQSSLPHLVITSDPSIKTVEQVFRPSFTTIQPALSRVAGVQVTPYSGAPGAWATVRIRGVANVTGSSQPLYVVDGVPVYNTGITPEMWANAYTSFNPRIQNHSNTSTTTPFTPNGNPLLDMPVEDVASVEVIQGAASTARYGMQGTNGVIYITTRRGADGGDMPQPIRVRYAGWGGVQQVRQRYELLNAHQYADLANVAAANNGYSTPYTTADLKNLGSVDWQDRTFRMAGVQSHNISLDGLTQRTRYYIAADYLNQAGVVINSHLNRYSLRANVDQQLTRKLMLSLKASGSRLDQRQPSSEPDAGLFLRNLLLTPPTLDSSNNPDTKDPLPSATEVYHTPRTYRLLTQLAATYTFSPDLTLSARGSFEQSDVRSSYQGPNVTYSDYYISYTEAATTHSHNWMVDATLRYQHTFREHHALTASLNYLRQKFKQRTKDQWETYSHETGSSSNNRDRSHSYWEYQQQRDPLVSMQSPSATFTYVYDKRYEVQTSLRSDFHFSKEYLKSEYYWFPGAELRWHLGQEAFLADVSWLNALTLQAGVGRTSSYFTPSRTIQRDAGLHLGVLGNKLTLDVTAYQRRTQTAQLWLIIPVTTATGYAYRDIYPDVDLQNRGLELNLGSSWQFGKLRGTSMLAAATNQNQITKTDLPETVNEGIEKGKSVSRFYASDQDGTYPVSSSQAGQVRFLDRNNDGQENDSYYQGSGLPRYTLNLYQQLRLQRVSLEAQFDGLFGYQLLNSTLVALDNPRGYYNASVRALDYWTPSNQVTSIPRPTLYQSSVISNQALESGDHVRLSQLTLGYELPSTGTRHVSIWIGGQNLFVTGHYRGFDPNVSSGGASPMQAGRDASVYPVARVWQLGLRATL